MVRKEGEDMGAFKDLTGMRFGYLTCIEPEKYGYGQYKWLCKCDCGRMVSVRSWDIKSGKTRSCGCMSSVLKCETRDKSGEESWKNRRYDRLYRVWQGMKERCYNKNNKAYKSYGGKGIKVCPEWEHNYLCFKAWAYENGYDDNAHYLKCTLDRIDNGKDYSPDNCRWVYDFKEQCRHKTTNNLISYNGETHCLQEWAEILGIHYSALAQRQRAGWSDEEIVKIPYKQSRRDYHSEEKKNEFCTPPCA